MCIRDRIINGGKYNGMDRYEARKAIVADLEAGGYLVKVEDYAHSVGCLLYTSYRAPAPRGPGYCCTPPSARGRRSR